MRINVIIPKEKNDCFDLFLTNSLNLSYEEMYGDKCGEFDMWILGLKGWCWADCYKEGKASNAM